MPGKVGKKKKFRITIKRKVTTARKPPYGRQVGHNSKGDGSKFEDYSGYTGSGK